MSLIQIGLLSVIEIVGDFGLKQYANNGGIIPLIIGIIGYIGVVIMLTGIHNFNGKWCMGWNECFIRKHCSIFIFRRAI
jgi:hypothetical protein